LIFFIRSAFSAADAAAFSEMNVAFAAAAALAGAVDFYMHFMTLLFFTCTWTCLI